MWPPTCSVRKSQACHCERWVRRENWTSHPFATQDVVVNRPDWPLGVALQRAREHAGLSVRAAARRTNGAISSGRWYQLESGYQKAGGHSIPVGTTPATVAAAASAIGWNVEEALATAGFDPVDLPAAKRSPLETVTDDELLSEVRRRMNRAAIGAPSSDNVQATGLLANFATSEDTGMLRNQDGEERDKRLRG